MVKESSAGIYEFEGYRLDMRRRELIEVGRNRLVALKPKEYEALVFFVERAGTLISKDALMQGLWPGRVVGENNLNQYVTALRQRLGEHGGGRSFIVSVRGRGYQFVPEVMRMHQPQRPERAQPMRAVPTSSVAAWQCFQQALFLSSLDDPVSWVTAVERLEHAISLDTRFGSALAALACIRVRLIAVDWPEPAALLDRAEQEAARALEWRPDLAFSHMAAGTVASERGRWIEAECRFTEAEALDEEWPVVGAMHATYVLLPTGQLDRALATSQASQSRAHGMMGITMIHGRVQLLRGDETGLRETCALLEAMGAQRNSWGLVQLFASLAIRAGRTDEAVALFLKSLTPSLRELGAEPMVARVIPALTGRSQRAEAVQSINEFVERAPCERIPLSFRHQIVDWYGTLGATERMLDFAGELLDHLEALRMPGHGWMGLWKPELREVRQHPRFSHFASRLKLPDYWMRFGGPEAT